jgi:hypothetical protein
MGDISKGVANTLWPAKKKKKILSVTAVVLNHGLSKMYDMYKTELCTTSYFRYNEADKEAITTYPDDDQAHRMIQNHCQGAEGLPLAVQVSFLTLILWDR